MQNCEGGCETTYYASKLLLVTCFEEHDALETGVFRLVNLHGLELCDDILERSNLSRHHGSPVGVAACRMPRVQFVSTPRIRQGVCKKQLVKQ